MSEAHEQRSGAGPTDTAGATARPCSRIGLVAAIVGVILIGAGAWRGDLTPIFQKATTICLQCIGIG